MFVDFKIVKEKVPITEILRHYNLLDGMRPKSYQLIGRCPLKEGSSESFTVNREKNIWFCFSCKRGGDILDFVAAKEHVPLQQAGELVAKWFGITGNADVRAAEPTVIQKNEPLGFELKSLNAKRPELDVLGVRTETLERFGAGYASTGLLKGRLAIPIHNVDGVLVAYAGLALDTGEYLYPKAFRPELEVFMLHTFNRLNAGQKEITEVFLTTDPFEVLRLADSGNTALALMSRKLSDPQEGLLKTYVPVGTRLRLLKFLNDRATEHIAGRLARVFSVTTIDCVPSA